MNLPGCSSSRRSFVKILALALLPLRMIFSTKLARATEQKLARNIRLSELAELKEGPNYFPIERVVVFKSSNMLRAMSIICTHQPCALKAHASGFDCTCHGSRFSLEGKVLNGPAREDLPYYKLSLDSQKYLIVHFDETVSRDWTLRIS